MTAPITITIPFDAGRCAPNKLSRMLWQQRKRVADAAKEAATAAWLRAGGPRAYAPVIVDLTIRRGRSMDADNAISACKHTLDGLFNGQITPSDSLRWVRLGEVRQETGNRWRLAPEVVVTIRPREEPS